MKGLSTFLVLLTCFIVTACVSAPNANTTPKGTSTIRSTTYEDETNMETPGLTPGERIDRPDVEVEF